MSGASCPCFCWSNNSFENKQWQCYWHYDMLKYTSIKEIKKSYLSKKVKIAWKYYCFTSPHLHSILCVLLAYLCSVYQNKSLVFTFLYWRNGWADNGFICRSNDGKRFWDCDEILLRWMMPQIREMIRRTNDCHYRDFVSKRNRFCNKNNVLSLQYFLKSIFCVWVFAL